MEQFGDGILSSLGKAAPDCRVMSPGDASLYPSPSVLSKPPSGALGRNWNLLPLHFWSTIDTLPLHYFPLWAWHKVHISALFHGVPTSFLSHQMLFSEDCSLFSSLALCCWHITVCALVKPSFGVSCCLSSTCPIPLGDPIRFYLTIFLCWVVLSSTLWWLQFILVQDLSENLFHLLFPLEYQIRWQHWEYFSMMLLICTSNWQEKPLFLRYIFLCRREIPFHNVLL